MPQFHETGYGKRFFDSQLPQLIKQLESIAVELKRLNDLNGTYTTRTIENDLKRLADDIQQYDYRIAQVLNELMKDD